MGRGLLVASVAGGFVGAAAAVVVEPVIEKVNNSERDTDIHSLNAVIIKAGTFVGVVSVFALLGAAVDNTNTIANLQLVNNSMLHDLHIKADKLVEGFPKTQAGCNTPLVAAQALGASHRPCCIKTFLKAVEMAKKA